jgi:hypothetical protein
VPSIFVKIGQPLRRKFWQRFYGVLDIFHPLPLAAAGVIFFLLWQVGQIRELYISYLEQRNWQQVFFAFIGFGLVSFVIYAGHYYLTTIRENVIYKSFVGPSSGVNFRWVRRWAGLVWAALPWCGMVLGLWEALQYLSKHETADILSAERVVNVGARVYPAMAIVIIAGIAVLATLYWLRRSSPVHWVTIGIVLALFCFAGLMPLIWQQGTVSVYRYLGPFATLAIEILFILSLVTLIALLSQKSELPVLTILLIALAVGTLFNVSFATLMGVCAVVCFVFVLLAFPARLWAVLGLAVLLGALSALSSHRSSVLAAKANQIVQDTAPAPHRVNDAFKQWLSSRTEAAAAGAQIKKTGASYPVFIIAVEGGGIYAAASAALFLAKLQDDCPDFMKHVFAISGVSGGAIGATIFHELAKQPRKPDGGAAEARCGGDASPAGRAAEGPLTREIAHVMQDDYFSPVVGAIWPDFLGEWTGREETLELSFLESVGRQDQNAKNTLDGWYLDHWQSGAALVLNTTSSETGYRFAFAPFGLHSTTDSALYSFVDDVRIDASSGDKLKARDVKLMFAALASARFPLIVPPYLIKVKDSTLNFVDGGYADNSGAYTALDIYRAIESTPTPDLKADIKIVLLTSDDPAPTLDTIKGTEFSDTLAPISAVLSVRKGLADQAVARVCDYFKQKGEVDEACNAKDPAHWHLKLAGIQDQAYQLPLGWKLSNTTFHVVSQPLIGRVGNPSECNKVAAARNNGCVLCAIEQAIAEYERTH